MPILQYDNTCIINASINIIYIFNSAISGTDASHVKLFTYGNTSYE